MLLSLPPFSLSAPLASLTSQGDGGRRWWWSCRLRRYAKGARSPISLCHGMRMEFHLNFHYAGAARMMDHQSPGSGSGGAPAPRTSPLPLGGSNTGPSIKAPPESITSITAHRRKRLVRSENVSYAGQQQCCTSRRHHYHHGWESIFRESLLHMAWPISLSFTSDGSGEGSAGGTESVIMDFLPLKIR